MRERVEMGSANEDKRKGKLMKAGRGVGGIQLRGCEGERDKDAILVRYTPYAPKDAKENGVTRGGTPRKNGVIRGSAVRDQANACVMLEGSLAEGVKDPVQLSLVLCTYPARCKDRSE